MRPIGVAHHDVVVRLHAIVFDQTEELLADNGIAIGIDLTPVSEHVDRILAGELGAAILVEEARDRKLAADRDTPRLCRGARIAHQQAAADVERHIARTQIAQRIVASVGSGGQHLVASGEIHIVAQLRDRIRISHPEIAAEEAEDAGGIPLLVEDPDAARRDDFEPRGTDRKLVARGGIDIAKRAFDTRYPARLDKHRGSAVVERAGDGHVTDEDIVRSGAIEGRGEIGGSGVDPFELGLRERVTRGFRGSAKHGGRAIAHDVQPQQIRPDAGTREDVQLP